ncbi:hypothetical protein [Bdellovibrio sp. NC01]|uniref:hypothetical protein n=1 Tax=Bdellovibrio sp. NC01 TaxID=2220073 RepID=UPI00115A5741|nr:hypothetical protein [Bdellovibrio sp. NC01]QDK37589.1 hypothetical protein DOE51_08320 [Bdellovibrio sp. NC01]
MKAKMIILSVLMSSSAFAAVQGKVSMKIDSSSAQIIVKNISVKEGDRVALYEETCQGPKIELCRKTKVGTGVVSRVISQDASEIKVDGNVKLKEGLLIEKE